MSLHGPTPYLNDDSYHDDIMMMMMTTMIMFLLAVASELILLSWKFSCFFLMEFGSENKIFLHVDTV